jgi:NAD dependent epimerase/dehydratase family enzyme
MRVFVAGATGAIGKQLVPRLVAAGHAVASTTLSTMTRPRSPTGRRRWVRNSEPRSRCACRVSSGGCSAADFLIASNGTVLASKHGVHSFDQWSVDDLIDLVAGQKKISVRS